MNFETMILATTQAEKDAVSEEIGRLIDSGLEGNLLTFGFELIQRISLLDTRSISKTVASQIMAKIGLPQDYFVEKAGADKMMTEMEMNQKMILDLNRLLGCMVKRHGKTRFSRHEINQNNVSVQMSYDQKRDCLVLERKIT